MTAAHPLARILEDLPSAAVATFLALFPIVNPFGGVPVFFSLTSSLPAAERRHTALKTAGYVIAILVVFLFFGRFVLIFFGISLPVLRIAGGLIVANGAPNLTRRSRHEEAVHFRILVPVRLAADSLSTKRRQSPADYSIPFLQPLFVLRR
ncbi:MAG: MarC family protein [Terriglobales bacterium]